MNLIIYIIFVTLGIFTSFSLYADTAIIITQENAIREDCKFFAPVKANVRYGDVIEVISQDGEWVRVP